MIYENITPQTFSTTGTSVYNLAGPNDVYGFIIHLNTEKANLVVNCDGTTRLNLHLKDDVRDGFKLNHDSNIQWVFENDVKRYVVQFPSPMDVRERFEIFLTSDSGTKRLERGFVIRES